MGFCRMWAGIVSNREKTAPCANTHTHTSTSIEMIGGSHWRPHIRIIDLSTNTAAAGEKGQHKIERTGGNILIPTQIHLLLFKDVLYE